MHQQRLDEYGNQLLRNVLSVLRAQCIEYFINACRAARGKGCGVAGAACMGSLRQSTSLIAVPGDLLARRSKPAIQLIDGLAIQHWGAIKLPPPWEEYFRLDGTAKPMPKPRSRAKQRCAG